MADIRPAGSDRGLVACLAYAALTGGVVAGLGNPLIYPVSIERAVPIADAQWVLILALLVGAVGTPILSRLADGPLRKRVLVGTLLTIAAGSGLALIPSFPALLIARGAEGLGYALVPLTVSVARDQLAGSSLVRALGILSVSVATGVGVGNPAIGLLEGIGGYRLPFLLATAVAATAAYWVVRRVPAVDRGSGRRIRLDLPGTILLAVALTALLLAIARGGAWGWTSPSVVTLAFAGVAALACWVVVERKVPEPLVDLRLATERGALGVHLVAALLGCGMFAGAGAVLLLVQSPTETGGLGRSVFLAGLTMVPMAIASLIFPSVALRLAPRIGQRAVLVLGTVAVAAAFGYFVIFHRGLGDIVLMMSVMGVGVGLAYSAMPAVIMAGTPPERTGSAMGANQVMRLIGGSVGGAAIAALLAARTPPGADHPDLTGYVLAGAFACGAAVVATIVTFVVVPNDRRRAPSPPSDPQPPA